MKTTRMKISIPADLARFVRESVESGAYSSANDVIRAGLRLLRRSIGGELRPKDGFDRARVARALDGLRQLSSTQSLGDGSTLRSLIDEGRA